MHLNWSSIIIVQVGTFRQCRDKTGNNMNLYIFNETRLGAMYGVGTYIRELATALKNSNINVCVVNLNSDKPQIKSEEVDGVLYLYFPAPIQWTKDLKAHWDLYHRNIAYWFQLHIKDKQGLIFHLNYSKKDILAEELRKTFDCRIVSVVHFYDRQLTAYDNWPQLQNRLNEEHSDNFSENLNVLLEEEKPYCSNADRIICLSNYMQKLLCRNYGLDVERISVIPNGLNDAFESPSDVILLRKKWNIQEEEKIILFAGRLNHLKGLEYLIISFQKVLNVFSQCRLMIVGEGAFNLYTRVSQDICTKVSFCGLLDKAKLYELYQIADIGVLPSFTEQCSYVAIEMMMHSLPMVTTSVPGLVEMVEDGISSLQVPIIMHPDRMEIDTDLLAEKMLYLLKQPNEAKRLGRNARKRYEEQYSNKIFSKNMLNFYHSLYD